MYQTWGSPTLINLTNLTRVTRYRRYRVTSFWSEIKEEERKKGRAKPGETTKRATAKAGHNRSKILAPQPSGLGGEQRIVPEFPKPRVCRQASPKTPEQVVKADPKESRRKRLLTVVILRSRKGSPGGIPKSPECRGGRTDSEVKLPEAFEGHAPGKSPAVGLGSAPALFKAGFGSLTGEGPGSAPPQLRNKFVVQVGGEKEAIFPYSCNEPPGAHVQSWIFHRHKISKNDTSKTPGRKPSRQGMKNPRTRSAKTGIFECTPLRVPMKDA